ncbi:MAG: cytochrome c [Bradyrhizobium sp.]|nr:c-type cytochrome [Pseudomonadota bacterium]MDE2067200.1 cytochrome c [Bradyrhizobium sp.]MDE2470556.1 cytochrome c [Bradyrhizobium sp.]
MVGLSVSLAACDNMANQPKLNPYELPYGSQTEWPLKPVPHTVARDEPLNAPSPPPVTMALLVRGQQRFNIYCSPCHSRLGDGNGMIVQRGFPHPPSYLSETLRQAPNQLFYDVITHGYGAMYSYADRVEPADRWAIVAYIRALQASASASLSDVPADKRGGLQ